MKVRIGRFPLDGDRQALLDIERLVETRALIQAASGFGKSYLLCDLIEATHGHIQQIIIDPEGEFAPLRAQHDFVIAAARNGDALAHPRTAALLSTRLLETKASAILDIYDVKPRERHEFVRIFIETMMNAPKDLWHPVLVVLDEAHLFCPEKGFGESEATDAVIDLAGRGRKRGFTLVAATQRAAKFNKNAAAELNNKFIGSASQDLDVKRSAFELGRTPKEALDDLRALQPGDFYAFGPALAMQGPALFHGDLPKTKLPKAGHRKLVAPPKPTDKIKALLPQLADLPREAEQKAKTEQELRKDLAEARKRIEKLEAEQRTAFMRAPVIKAPAKQPNYKGAHREAKKFLHAIEDIAEVGAKQLQESIGKVVFEWRNTMHHRFNTSGENALEEIRKAAEAQVEISGPIVKPIKIDEKLLKPGPITRVEKPDVFDIIHSDDSIPGPEKKVLNAIAWMSAATGTEWVTQTAAAFMAGYSPGSSSFRNPRSALAAKGLIEYHADSRIKLTMQGGLMALQPKARPTAQEIQSHVLHLLNGPEKKLLEKLLEAYPAGIMQDEHAKMCNYAPGSSSYRNPRSKLSALGLLRYSGDSMVYAEPWLFLE